MSKKRPIDAVALSSHIEIEMSQYGEEYDAYQVLSDVEDFPTLNPWRSVKDEMPPDGKFVLVCNDDGKMLIAKYESEVPQWEYKYINYDWDVWDDDEQGPVCYWCYLPDPPKNNLEKPL